MPETNGLQIEMEPMCINRNFYKYVYFLLYKAMNKYLHFLYLQISSWFWSSDFYLNLSIFILIPIGRLN